MMTSQARKLIAHAPSSFSEDSFVNTKSNGEFSVLMTNENDRGDHFIGNLNNIVAELNALEVDLIASIKVFKRGG